MKNPRQWYYALMDYGVMLKKEYKNPARRSKHYTVQSKFEGSDRQIRGKILHELLTHGSLTLDELCELVVCDYERLTMVINHLCIDNIVKVANKNIVSIKD